MEASTLKVMSFNIRYDNPRDGDHAWNARKQAVIQLINEEKPDLLGIQEGLIHQVKHIEEHFPHHERVGVGRDDGGEEGEHAALFCLRDRVKVERSGTFWLSDTPGVPGSNTWNTGCRRVCTWCIVTLLHREGMHRNADDSRVLVMNTHLDNASRQAREKGAKLIVNKMNELHPVGPCIVMGDLNTRKNGERTVAIITRGEAGRRLIKAGQVPRQTGMEMEAGFTWHDFRGADARWYHPRGYYDYIFYTAGFKEVESRIVTRTVHEMYPSDHFPVIAVLHVGNQ